MRKHIGSIDRCQLLTTIGPNLTVVPQNYNCAYDSGTTNTEGTKCEVSRRKGLINSDAELAQLQKSWNRYKKRVENLPTLTRDKRGFFVPLIALWTGIISGQTYINHKVGTTNEENIEIIRNITSEHTRIHKESIGFYEQVKKELLAHAE